MKEQSLNNRLSNKKDTRTPFSVKVAFVQRKDARNKYSTAQDQ